MNVAIAGGGTGGHLFPGVAIAEEFLIKDPSNRILFIGTQSGLETRILPKIGFRLKTVKVKGLKGADFMKKVSSLALLPWAFLKSFYYLKQFKAHLVVGLGGYVSIPSVLAGIAGGASAAIHEQNSFPGLSNRILGKLVDKVFVSYEESFPFFPQSKTVLTGVPIRHQFLETKLSQKNETFTILVLGGSQGSHAINESMLDALPFLVQVREKIYIIHQSGSGEQELVQERYKQYGFHAEVVPFIEDMPTNYGKAHLIISRAGAATLAEIMFCRRAALLIPFPYATDNHQESNAKAIVTKGAALMVLSRDVSGERLASIIMDLERDRRIIEQMEKEAEKLAKPNAAEQIVRICYQQVLHKGKKEVGMPN
jgi:UDP-N-acetylglucosamine--N-acetylmuramyl-(pentapeptide) pyrophosphoryl-undecaprenol N-acetylglucosamine transferase